MLEKIQVENAVGLRLAHDLTRIVPGFKGAAFRRGHVVRKSDIPKLLDLSQQSIHGLVCPESNSTLFFQQSSILCQSRFSMLLYRLLRS